MPRSKKVSQPIRDPSPDMEDDSDSGKSEHGEDGMGKSSQVRKAQNRLAQREFRLRKQQYVRDLEARVEVLSADKEDRVELMTLLIRNLLKENKELREMLKSMASFVGEGLGSCLPRLGLSAPQLEAILSRADTDTAHEAFLALKASTQMQKDNPGIPLGEPRRGSVKRKRGTQDDLAADGNKGSAAGSATPDGPAQTQPLRQETENYGNYSYLFPDLNAFANVPTRQPVPASQPNGHTQVQPPPPPIPPPPAQWTPTYATAQTSAYPSPMQFNQMTLPRDFYQQPFDQSGFGVSLPASNGGGYANPTTNPPGPEDIDEVEHQRRLRAAVVKITAQKGHGPMGAELTADQVDTRRKAQEEIMDRMREEEDPEASARAEALQLISYHLNNFRTNHKYSLPASLRPTHIQQTVPHECAIDGVIFPSVRDAMILHRDQFDLVEALHGGLSEFIIHGPENLDHHNWEMSESWLRKFGTKLMSSILVNDEVYEITNRWRRSRGDMPLSRTQMDSSGNSRDSGPWDRRVSGGMCR